MEDLLPVPSAVQTSCDACAEDADTAILARIAAGDCDALGELCDRWEGRVHAFAACAFDDAAECEAVVEEVFWTVWRQSGTRGWNASGPSAWLRGIVWDVCRPRLAHRTRSSPMPGSVDGPGEPSHAAQAPAYAAPAISV